MAELELTEMIMSFRVTELQVLLGFAGRNKTGRKQELQARALELLKLRSAPIQMKIRDLHKKYPGHSSSNSETSTGPSAAQTSPKNSTTSSQKSSSYPSYGSSSTSSSMGSSVAMPRIKQQDYGTPPKPAMSGSSSVSSNFPVHPDVKFKPLPFYDKMAELLKPTSLIPSASGRFQESNFVFHLTPQQAQDVAMSRDIRPGTRMEFSVQVQLRFCLLETSCEQDDNFPPSICAKINGKMCPLPNPIPTNKPGVEPKRPSRPVNITSLCRLSPTMSNHIDISWASEYGRGYTIGVYLVRRLTSMNLLQRLKSKGIRNADHTRALIKEKLSHDADSEIATTSLRVSLMCPLGKMRMQIASRAQTCTHLQCFDASLYLQMNEKKPTWICPVCDKPATFKNLIIDGLFMEIFQKSPDCNEIKFLEDGSWAPLLPKKETHVVTALVTKSSEPLSPIAIDSTGSPSPPIISEPVAGPSNSKKTFQMIDLTESTDDEEEEEPPCKTPRLSDSPIDLKTSGRSSPALSNSSDSISIPMEASQGRSTLGGASSPVVIDLDSPSPCRSVSPLGSQSPATTADNSSPQPPSPIFVSSVLSHPRVGVVLQMSPHSSSSALDASPSSSIRSSSPPLLTPHSPSPSPDLSTLPLNFPPSLGLSPSWPHLPQSSSIDLSMPSFQSDFVLPPYCNIRDYNFEPK